MGGRVSLWKGESPSTRRHVILGVVPLWERARPYRRDHVITGGVLVGGAFPCGRGYVTEGGVSLWEEHFLVEEAVHDSRCVLVGMGASL